MNYTRHDEALALLSNYGPDLSNGLTSHVPMVAEALAAMGEDMAAVEWVDRNRHTIVPRVRYEREDISDLWPVALGKHEKNEAWSAFFLQKISERGWQNVCEYWAARFASGFSAAATHGVIRTAHAARALTQGVTDLRLREFADGLALWASTYRELPAKIGEGRGLSPWESLKLVPMVPEAERRNGGSITAALGQLKHASGFADTINFVALGPEIEARVLDIAEVFAHVIVQNVRTPLSAVVFTHGVTSILAVRNLLPHVSPVTQRLLLMYGWHTSAALYSAYADTPFCRVSDCGDVDKIDRVGRAVVNGDDHVIKLTEACLTFFAARPLGVFLKATDVVAQHLERERLH